MACGKTPTASGEAPKRCGDTSKPWCEAPMGFGKRAKGLGKSLDLFRVEASGFGVAPIGCGMTGNLCRQPPIAMGEVPMGCRETPRDFDERPMDRAGGFANAWYLEHTQEAITELRSQGLPEDAYLQGLAKRGGTNIAASLGFLIMFLLAIVVLISLSDLLL